jgi:CheY-like chemotaxis protein
MMPATFTDMVPAAHYPPKPGSEAWLNSLERYASIVHNAVEGIFQSTPDGRYLLVNNALARMYGYESVEDLLEGVRDISRSVYVDQSVRGEFKRLGGTMDVISEVGKGSTFRFSILVEAMPNKPRPCHGSPRAALSGRRLLIVDDNATNRRILTGLAQNWGMQSEATESGPDTLKLLATGAHFDFAILDMQMPEMDGCMLAAEIRKIRPAEALPLILLSSLGQRDMIPDKSLFAALLTKPTKPAQIIEHLARLAVRETAEPKAAPSPPEPKAGPASHDRILLAEDNSVNQKVALHMLARLGYRADVAANGLEVLDAMRRQFYDIIFMDLQMPEMDGLEATAKLRAAPTSLGKRPWIVALTANAMQGDRERCIASGMDDYITKPVKTPDLAAAIARANATTKPSVGVGVVLRGISGCHVQPRMGGQ